MSKYYFPGPSERFYPSIVIDGSSLEGIPGAVRELDPELGQVPSDGLWFEVPDDFQPPAEPENAAQAPSPQDTDSVSQNPRSEAQDLTPPEAPEHPEEAGASAPAQPFALGQEG